MMEVGRDDAHDRLCALRLLKVTILIEDFSCAFETSGFEKSRIASFVNFRIA